MAAYQKHRSPEQWLATCTGRGTPNPQDPSSSGVKVEEKVNPHIILTVSLVYESGQSAGPGGRHLWAVNKGLLFGDQDDEEELKYANRWWEKELGGEGDADELDFEEDFADDDEKYLEDNQDEEVKELEVRFLGFCDFKLLCFDVICFVGSPTMTLQPPAPDPRPPVSSWAKWEREYLWFGCVLTFIDTSFFSCCSICTYPTNDQTPTTCSTARHGIRWRDLQHVFLTAEEGIFEVEVTAGDIHGDGTNIIKGSANTTSVANLFTGPSESSSRSNVVCFEAKLYHLSSYT